MQHVIVTGGSRGLGLNIVRALLEDGSYRISTCSRTRTAAMDELEGRHPDRFRWFPCEVGDADQVDKFLEAAETWGAPAPLYGLVNNAGIAMEKPLPSYPHDESERLLRVNLLGAIQMTHAFLKHRADTTEPGRIVNISSVVGIRGYSLLSTYAASKAGLDGLTRSLAQEWGRAGVTVNSIAPGYLITDMTDQMTEKQRAALVRRTPLRRLGRPSDVTPLLRLLLGPEGSFVTGQTLVVDGGLSV